MELNLPDDQLSRFSGFVAEATGLHFPPARWSDLKRGIVATASALGFEDAAACARGLMSTPPTRNQLEVLASHLTVGETYFFRDNRSFEVLAERILPPLMRQRQDSERHLRIWSAACCTGEEAYSIAISLRRAIPDWEEWNITLLASDINPVFLRKAESGVFGQWSFRETPGWLKEQYFHGTADGQFRIRPEIRQMVRFLQLNLADDVYPSLATNTNAMDVIYCRNVLMYFTASQAANVIRKLYRAQVDGGWLIVGASEMSQVSSTPYVSANVPDAALYRKDGNKPRTATIPSSTTEIRRLTAECPVEDEVVTGGLPIAVASPKQPSSFAPIHASGSVAPASDAYAEAMELYKQGDYAGTIAKLREQQNRPPNPAVFGLLARSLANQGRLHEALNCCDQWIAADKLNVAGHYLRALILQERGALDDAVQSLRNALYLDPKFVLAHFVLGNIARDRGHVRDARKHLTITQQLLGGYRPDEVLPESEGVTAGRFVEIVRSLTNGEAAV